MESIVADFSEDSSSDDDFQIDVARLIGELESSTQPQEAIDVSSVSSNESLSLQVTQVLSVLQLSEDEQLSENEPIVIESSESSIVSSEEVHSERVSRGSELTNCCHDLSSFHSLILPDATGTKRCIQCFRARLCKFEDHRELVKDLEAFEYLLKSNPDSRRPLEILMPSEACTFLEILTSCDSNNDENTSPDIYSPLVSMSTQLLSQLVSFGASCATPDLVRTILRITPLIKPTGRAGLLSAVSSWIRITPEGTSQLKTEMVRLLDESVVNLANQWTPATVNAFVVLTDLIERLQTDEATSKRYVDLCLDLLNRSELNQTDAVDMSRVGGVAIRGLSALATSRPGSIFEPASPTLVNLFKNLHTFSQPVVSHLCGILTSAVEKYGSATQVAARGCFDGLLGDFITNCPSLGSLISVLDCLIYLGESSDFFAYANTSWVLSPLIGLLDTRRHNVDSPENRKLLGRVYELIAIICSTKNSRKVDGLSLLKLYEHAGEQYKDSDLRRGVVKMFAALLHSSRWSSTVSMKSCLNAIYSSITSHVDDRTSLDELLMTSCLFIELLGRTQTPVIHSSSLTRTSHQRGNSQDAVPPAKYAHDFITQCLPILTQKAVSTMFNNEQLSRRILELLSGALRIILTFSLPSDARDAAIECLRQIKRLVNIREIEGQKLLFYFILANDNDISRETCDEIQTGLKLLLEEESSSPNSEYCALMLYALVRREDATLNELSALISRILETFAQWRSTFQRNGFRLLLRLLTNQHSEGIVTENPAMDAVSDLITAMKPETVELLTSDFVGNVDLLGVVTSHERLSRFGVRATLTAWKKGHFSLVINLFAGSVQSTERFAHILTTPEALEMCHTSQVEMSTICKIIKNVAATSADSYRRLNPIIKYAILLMDMAPSAIGEDLLRIRTLLQLAIVALKAVPIIPSVTAGIDIALHSKFVHSGITFYDRTEALNDILIILNLILQKTTSSERSVLVTIIGERKSFLQKASESHLPLALQLLVALRAYDIDFRDLKVSAPRLQSMALNPELPIPQRIYAIQMLTSTYQRCSSITEYFQLEPALPVESLERTAHRLLLSPLLEKAGLELWKAIGGEVISILTIRLKTELGGGFDDPNLEETNSQLHFPSPLRLEITRELEQYLPPPEYTPRTLAALLQACRERRPGRS